MLCKCGCGLQTSIAKRNSTRDHMIKGLSMRYVSGHNHRKHGQSGSPEHRAWSTMIARCTLVNNPIYRKWYISKGIKVCARWRKSFPNFLADMGKKRSSRLSLDRIDSRKGYFPSNCRWATWKQQGQNRTSNKLTLETVQAIRSSRGVSQKHLAVQFGVHPSAISRVLSRQHWG